MSDLMKQIEQEVKGDRELARLVNQEELIINVTESILERLDDKGMTKADLAEILNKSKSHVTQILRGSRNMTLRTVADIFFDLGYKVVFNTFIEETSSCGFGPTKWKHESTVNQTSQTDRGPSHDQPSIAMMNIPDLVRAIEGMIRAMRLDRLNLDPAATGRGSLAALSSEIRVLYIYCRQLKKTLAAAGHKMEDPREELLHLVDWFEAAKVMALSNPMM